MGSIPKSEHARALHSEPLENGLDARMQIDTFSIRVEDSPTPS